MTIPLTGIILLPLGLLIALLPWRYCLVGLVVFAMMSPAAVVNAGAFGLQPGYYLSLLLIARTAFEIMAQRFILNAFVLSRLLPLLVFAIVCLLALFVAIAFFQGRIETLPGTSGFKSTATQPFYLGRENFTQLAYFVVNLCLLYTLGHQAGRRHDGTIIESWDRAIACGLLFSAGVCLWQFSSLYAGVPFPADFFYSNAGYGRSESQSMAGLFRINGPFEEPSTVGYIFTGYLLFGWMRYRLYPTALSALMIVLSLFCLLVSTSTTAFLGVIAFGCLFLFDVVTGRISLMTRRLSAGQWAMFVAGLAVIAIAAVAISTNWPAISVILQNTVFDKSESTSFQQRSFADLLGLQILIDTYGIGLGLGSHKANSLIVTLLSNAGVVGLAAFLAFVYTALSAAVLPEKPIRALLPFQGALAGLLIVHAISNPNLSSLALWVHLGALISLQTALRGRGVHPPLLIVEQSLSRRANAVI